jgi:hypothetical protein
MNSPEEKAKELVDKMYQYQWRKDTIEFRNAKQCALIAVEEILELKETQEEYQIQYENGEWSRDIGYKYSKYWEQVKQEIQKL